jgi:hypothetical protein
MSRNMDTLIPEFRDKVDPLLVSCEKQGVTMRPFFTERPPWAQARIWRSTRSTLEVTRATERLKANGASYLAEVLLMVGPQYSPPSAGRHLTYALPGLSWHQWGEALDCFWLLNNQAEWSVKKVADIGGGQKINGYFLYADEAVQAGFLSAGLSWGWDWPHVQLRSFSSPRDVFSWESIDSQMLAKFGTTEVS